MVEVEMKISNQQSWNHEIFCIENSKDILRSSTKGSFFAILSSPSMHNIRLMFIVNILIKSHMIIIGR
jgi:hypothetical protein